MKTFMNLVKDRETGDGAKRGIWLSSCRFSGKRRSSIIALQGGVNFCCTRSESAIRIHLSLLRGTSLHLQPTSPTRPDRARSAHTFAQQLPAVCFTRGSAHHQAQSPRPRVHGSLLYVCDSVPALQIGPSASFLDPTAICASARHLLFSF